MLSGHEPRPGTAPDPLVAFVVPFCTCMGLMGLRAAEEIFQCPGSVQGQQYGWEGAKEVS